MLDPEQQRARQAELRPQLRAVWDQAGRRPVGPAARQPPGQEREQEQERELSGSREQEQERELAGSRERESEREVSGSREPAVLAPASLRLEAAERVVSPPVEEELVERTPLSQDQESEVRHRVVATTGTRVPPTAPVRAPAVAEWRSPVAVGAGE